MIKTNYIIATWNGVRVKPVDQLYYEDVLKNHLQILLNTKHNLSQITIMRPYNDLENGYYTIDGYGDVKIIGCKNEYQSYGQWLKAVEIYLDNFDYFIFIEDDYVPNVDNFDTKLIDIYKEGSYLCSTVSGSGDNAHCAISNGIISNNTIRNLITKIKYNQWLDNFSSKNLELVFNGTNHQRAFSRYLAENGITLVDYRNDYMVDYYANGIFTDFSISNPLNNQKIFTPIQNIIK